MTTTSRAIAISDHAGYADMDANRAMALTGARRTTMIRAHSAPAEQRHTGEHRRRPDDEMDPAPPRIDGLRAALTVLAVRAPAGVSSPDGFPPRPQKSTSD